MGQSAMTNHSVPEASRSMRPPSATTTSRAILSLAAASDKIARDVVVADGGRIERDASGTEWFVIADCPIKTSALVSLAKPGPVAGSRYTAEEMKEVRFLPYTDEEFRKNVWKVWGVDSKKKGE